MICARCFAKFNMTLCPLPTYDCQCKGTYCRLLGRDPTKDLLCPKCAAEDASIKELRERS
jgi:hypothetical protein